uniref:Uncharacterized protein n=1 Tax=viral metagenome TaxID=1070528 RepID=A0A6H1ZQ11_9ZZZZ
MKQEQIDHIVEQMPKAWSPYFSDDRIWDKAAKAQAELMINGGFRQVPSVDEIVAFSLQNNTNIHTGKDYLSLGVKTTDFHRWLLERE